MKFSIRDLLLVTVIVAILVAWFIDHRRQAASVKKWKERATFREVMPLVIDIPWNDESPNSSAPAPNPPKP